MSGSVLVGLSGGADSCAAVLFLRKQGYEVTGCVLDLSPAFAPAVEAARLAAKELDLPLEQVTAHELFDEKVIAPFCRAYREGHTPNPCILCNPAVKFALLEQTADRLGCDRIATGHYARIEMVDGTPVIARSRCLARDQSYMLYGLTLSQRQKLLLPLGEAESKEDIREMNREAGLSSADSPDSQEICFIPEGNHAAYIENRLGPEKPGVFISPEGSPCGEHAGVSRFTVGQRKGLGIALGRPVFVRAIDAESGRVYLADGGQEYAPAVRLTDLCWQLPEPKNPLRVEAKIRSMARPVPAVCDPSGILRFDEPQRAPAPGQAAVLYCGDRVAGGGRIGSWLD